MTRATMASFLLGIRLGDHNGHSHKNTIRHALAPIHPKRTVHIKEVKEQRGGDSLIAVKERVVLRNKVEQVRGLLL